MRVVAVLAVLLGAAVVGAALGVPDLAGATSSVQAAARADRHGPKGPDGTPGLDAAAKALGITTDELHADLDSGKTIAQVASDKGVDVNTVIDAMVAAAQDGLRQRITDYVNNGHPRTPGHGARPPFAGRPHDLDAAANAIGISVDELMTDLRSGKSIAQVASDHGVDVNAVISAIVGDATARIDRAVADGTISQADADQQKANLTQRATDFVNRTPGRHGPKGPWRSKQHHDDEASSTQSSSSGG